MYKEMDEQENCQRDFPRCKDGSGLLEDIGQLVCNNYSCMLIIISVIMHFIIHYYHHNIVIIIITACGMICIV